VRRMLCLLFISSIISFNCVSTKYNKADAWKEKYGIEPNTGVFIAKLEISGIWKGKKIYYWLTEPKYAGKLIAYDTISRDGIVEIKNLKAGKYYLSGDTQLYFIKKDIPQENIGITPLHSGGLCKTYTIYIRKDSITYIEYESPGSSMTDEVVLGYENTRPKYNCELNQTWIKLDEISYLKSIGGFNENNN
jgi:hypothetical protein